MRTGDPPVRSVGPAVADLARTLPVPERVRLLTGAGAFRLATCPAIGLRELRLSDGPGGVRGLRSATAGPAAQLPCPSLLAQSWDEDVATRAGRLVGSEAVRQGVHMVLGPTVNLHRSPLGGRLFECFSEDPLLSGRLGAAWVRGLQSRGVAACVKHLVANESETARTTVDSVVDEATLREVYLLPFEIAVRDAHPWSVMAAYNRVNGIPATQHRAVLDDVLRGEWSWDGVVVSDWSATQDGIAAARGGLDLVMPGPNGPWGPALVGAIERGEVRAEVVDRHLVRVLRLARRTGRLAPVVPGGIPVEPRATASAESPSPEPGPCDPGVRATIAEMAARSMVVLVNRDTALPLRPATRVALIGRHARETVCAGAGSAAVRPPHRVDISTGLEALIGERLTVNDGVRVRSRPPPAAPGVLSGPGGSEGVRLTLTGSRGRIVDDRRLVAADLTVGFDDDLVETVEMVRFRGELPAGGPWIFGIIGAGHWTGRVGDERLSRSLAASPDETDMVRPPSLTVGLPAGPRRSFDIVADRRIVGGTVPMSRYGLVAHEPETPDGDLIDAAARAAREADVAVVVVGLTEEQESEAVDKTTLRLPGRQDDMVEAVAAAAIRTVVVVNAATPVLMPWLDRVDAVLFAGLPGQEAGHAVAAALTGVLEPSGRLVTSFPASDGDGAAWSVTPDAGRVVYREGPFIGYRGCAARRSPAPVFWFGHGLGYSSWRWSDPVRLGEWKVAVTVRNTGQRDSREVVQLYVRPRDPERPVHLIGWRAVDVRAGDEVTVEVEGDPFAVRRWDTDRASWRVDTDEGELLLARGLGDVRHVLAAGSSPVPREVSATDED